MNIRFYIDYTKHKYNNDYILCIDIDISSCNVWRVYVFWNPYTWLVETIQVYYVC